MLKNSLITKAKLCFEFLGHVQLPQKQKVTMNTIAISGKVKDLTTAVSERFIDKNFYLNLTCSGKVSCKVRTGDRGMLSL